MPSIQTSVCQSLRNTINAVLDFKNSSIFYNALISFNRRQIYHLKGGKQVLFLDSRIIYAIEKQLFKVNNYPVIKTKNVRHTAEQIRILFWTDL